MIGPVIFFGGDDRPQARPARGRAWTVAGPVSDLLGSALIYAPAQIVSAS
jgi:hypothetical protein